MYGGSLRLGTLMCVDLVAFRDSTLDGTMESPLVHVVMLA